MYEVRDGIPGSMERWQANESSEHVVDGCPVALEKGVNVGRGRERRLKRIGMETRPKDAITTSLASGLLEELGSANHPKRDDMRGRGRLFAVRRAGLLSGWRSRVEGM